MDILKHIQKSPKKQEQGDVSLDADLMVKEEFEYRPSLHSQRGLALLQKLSLLTIFLSAYQLAHGILLLTYSTTPLPTTSLLLAFFSLILSICLKVWTVKVQKAEQERTAFAQDLIGGAWEKFNVNLMISLLARGGVSLVLILNHLFQRSYDQQRLYGHGATFSQQNYISASNLLDLLAMPFPIFELIICVSFLKGARTCFNYIKEPSKAISNLMLVFNSILMASSLASVFAIIRLQGFHLKLKSTLILREENLTGLLVLGILFSILALLNWLVVSRKWRVPSLLTTSLMIVFTIALSVFTINSYKHTINVQRSFEDISEMEIWVQRMDNAHQDNIEAFGCPSKYLPKQDCPTILRTSSWEDNMDTEEVNNKCLNIECAGLLGGLYARPFLEITTLIMISLVSSLFVILGGLYFLRKHWNFINPDNKKGYKWLLVLLGIMAVISIGGLVVSNKPYINEKVPTPGFVPPEMINFIDSSRVGGIILSRNRFAKKVNEFLFYNKDRFLIFGLTLNGDVILEEKGGKSRSYDDLLDKLETKDARYVLARVQLEGKNRIRGIIWIPDSSSEEEREAYLQKFGEGNLGVPSLSVKTIIASSRGELDEDNLMATYSVEGSGSFQVEQDAILQERQEIATVLASNVNFTSSISPSDGFDIFTMIAFKSFKFLVLRFDSLDSRLYVESKGNWRTTYDDFVACFNDGSTRLGFIYLEIEGESKLVLVVFENEFSTTSKEMFMQQGLSELKEMNELGVYLYLASDLDDLKLENVMKGITSQTKPEGQLRYLMALSSVPDVQRSNVGMLSLRERYPDLQREPKRSTEENIQNMQQRLLTSLVGETGFSIGLEAFMMIVTKNHRYLIESYNQDLGKVQITATGNWNSDYDSFLNDVDFDEPQVCLIYFDLEDSKELAMIIYVPKSYDLEATYKLFSLPKDPFRLEKLGLSVILARSQDDMAFDKILNHIYADQSKLFRLIERTETRLLAQEEVIGQRMLEESPYRGDLAFNEDVQKVINERSLKFVILGKDPETDEVITIRKGEKGSAFKDLVYNFNKNQRQIGLLDLRLETMHKLVLVGYSPDKNEDIIQILRALDFKDTLADLQSLGVKALVFQNPGSLTVKRILKRIYTDESKVSELIEAYGLSPHSTKLCGCLISHPENTSSLEDRWSGTNTNLIFRSGQMKLDFDSDILKPLKAKKFKYIVLARNLQVGRPYIVDSGNWSSTFEEFADDFEENMPQIGFFVLEVEAVPKIVMILYIPPGSTLTEKQVLKDFRITQDPNQLRKKGIEILVANSIEDITVENMINSLYGSEISEMSKLMEIVQEYTSGHQCNLTGSLENEELTFLVSNPLELKLSKDWISMVNDRQNKYVIFGLETKSVRKGNWYSNFKKFARDFDPVENQVGFITVELGVDRKMIMVLFSPDSEDLTPQEVFDRFDVASSLSTLESHQVSVFIARNKSELRLENILNKLSKNGEQSGTMTINPNLFFSDDPDTFKTLDEVVKILNHKKYKYAIIKHDNQSNVSNIIVTGEKGALYDNFLESFNKSHAEVGFVFVGIEAQEKLVMILYSPTKTSDQILADFGFPCDLGVIEKAGVNVYIAKTKKELEVSRVISGIFSKNVTSTSRAVSSDTDEKNKLPES